MKKQQKLRTRLRATKSRLAAFLLAATAATGAWAATLSYSGYISTDSANPTTVFTDVSLSDIGYKYALTGNMGGANLKVSGVAGVYNESLSGSTLTVQFQRIDDGYCKVVEVKFTESNGSITAYANRAGYTQNGSLGPDPSNWWGTPVDSASGKGYGIYDVALVSPYAGTTLKVTNVGQSSTQSPGNLAATDTYTMTYPTASLASGYVRLSSFAFGMNSSSDAFNTKYVTCVDYRGTNVVSAIANGTGSIQTSTKFGNNSLKESYAFGGAGAANECIIKVGTGYTFGMQDGNGTNVLQRVYMINTTNGDYSPVKQSASATSYRATQEVVATVVASAETSAGGNWSELFTNAPTDWTSASSAPVLVVVTDDCSIALDTAVSAESVIFDVASGKTLTLTGSSTITAANGIFVRGGSVVVPGAATLSGTVKGDGTVIYTAKPTTLTLTDADWNGVLWLKNVAVDAADPSTLAGENSVLRLTGCTGYFNPSTKMTCECLGTLDLQDDGSTKAFTVNNGWSANGITIFAKLTGDGSLVCSTRDISQRYVFKDASSFQGTINCVRSDTSGKYLRVILGDGSSLSPDNGTITVVAGATAAVGDGKTWSADKIVVNGALTIGSGATVSKIASSSTGSVTVTSGTGTVSGVDGSEFPATIVVYPSATLAIADTSATALKIPAEFVDFSDFTYYNEGTLDLKGCTALTTLYLDMGSSTTFNLANVSLPASCTTVAIDAGEGRSLSGYSVTKAASGQDGVTIVYAVEETKEEYGTGSLEVTNVPEGATVYVKRADGTTVAATVTDGTARLSDFGEIKIDGAATLFDVTFTNSTEFAYKPAGSASYVHNTGVYNNVNGDKSTGCMLYVTPWLGSGSNLTELPNFQNCMTLAVVGQMPAAQDDAMFIHLGGCASGYKGFLIARMAEDNKVRVAYNNGSTVTTLTTMTVPNASTARHAYVITKEDTASTTTFTIYLDGIKWKTVTLNSVLTISGGVQVGSDFHGEIHTNTQTDEDGVTQYTIKSLTSSASPGNGYVTDTTGYVNCIRLYDRILTQAEINQYSDPSEYPYVSPNGSAVRTFTAAGETWVDTTENSTVWANTTAAGVTTESGTPASGAALTVNTETATTIGVNLDSNVSYEAITVNGTGATFQFSGESTGKITVTGSSVIGAPTTIVAGALDISGGPVTMTEDGSLTFDYSNYEVTSATAIQLTGPVAQNDSAVSITVPTNPYYTYTSGWDSGSEQYLITPTLAVAVLNHNDTLTGYTSIAEAVAAAENGDTITLQTTELTPSTLIYTATGEDKSRVTFIIHGVSVAGAYADSNTTWTTDGYYHWTGEGDDSNWTTPDNWGLTTVYPNANDAAVTFGATANVTLSGTVSVGSMEIASGATSSIAGGQVNVYGNISGAGTLSLNGVVVYFATGAQAVSAALDAVEGSTNTLRVKQGTGDVDLTGALSGKGAIVCTIDGNRTNGGHVDFLGDTSAFEGSVTFENNGNQRASHQIAAAAATNNAKSTWTLNAGTSFDGNGSSYTDYFPLRIGSTTYTFGALNGTIPWAKGSSGWLTGVTLEVGALNADCALMGDWNGVTAAGLNWVATSATMTYGVQNNAFINITGGGSVTLNNTSIMRTGATIGFSGNGGTLKIAGSVDYDPSAFLASTGTPVVFDDDGVDRTWATAIPAAVTGGFTKKGAGTLTLSAVPAYTGATTVEAGTLVIPGGTELGTLTIADGAYVQIDAANGETITVGSFADGDTTKGRIRTYKGTSIDFVLNDETGKYVGTVTRSPLTYTWTGATSTSYETLGNWTITINEETTTPDELPTDVDTVVFPASETPWTVELSSSPTLAAVQFAANTTLSGAIIYTKSISASSGVSVTLGNSAGFGDNGSDSLAIANMAFVVTAAEETPAVFRDCAAQGVAYKTSIADTTVITGTGYIRFETLNDSGSNAGIHVNADMRGFAGTVTIPYSINSYNNVNRNATYIGELAYSESASWVLYNASRNGNAHPFFTSDTTYKFGSLTGSPDHDSSDRTFTLEIGALGLNDTLAGRYFRTNAHLDYITFRGATIRKVGTGTLTFTGTHVHAYELQGGVLSLSSSASLDTEYSTGNHWYSPIKFTGGTLSFDAALNYDPSAQIADSTSAIVFDDGGENRTWATALAASNVGGLTKKGSGTLTLSAAPLLTGAITVAENGGAIVLPEGDYTLGANTIVSSRDTANGTMTLAYATTVELTVPSVANTTVEVTAGGETLTEENGVYMVPVGSDSVVVTYTGANGYTVLNGVFNVNINEATTLDISTMNVAATATWTGGGTDTGWSTGANWSTGTEPTSTTHVVFPDTGSAYTVWISNGAVCGTMEVNGDVTFAQWDDSVEWTQAISLYGDITGEGSITLSRAGIWCGNTSGVVIDVPLNVADTRDANDAYANSWLTGYSVTVNGDMEVAGQFRSEYGPHTYNGDIEITGQFVTLQSRDTFTGVVTIADGKELACWGDNGFTFNGATIVGEGTGNNVWVGASTEGSDLSLYGTGLTVSGTVTVNSGAAANLVVPVKLTGDAVLTVNSLGTVTSVGTDAVGHEVNDNESTPRVYTCQWASSAVPAIDTSVETPVTVTSSTVTFAVSASSLVSGLYYRVKAVDGNGNESATASTEKVKFTGENASELKLTAKLPAEGVLYYTIEASDSAN